MNENFRAHNPVAPIDPPWIDNAPPIGVPVPPPELKISASPFVWRDPKAFPRRRWLYGHHLIRKFTSCTVAPGGLGKTSLVLTEAVAMATGRPLLGIQSPEGPLTVWVVNLEDPQEEIERRVTAILLHYKIDPAELGGRLYIDSGRSLKLIVAETTRDGTTIARPMVEALITEMSVRKIDVLTVDPFVKSHRVSENDNSAIDVVCSAYAEIADRAGAAVEIVHHVRKTSGAEITVEDGRGAVALLSAVRSARAINGMSKEEADKLGEGTNPREFFRVANGKLNMAPAPLEKAEWFQLRSVSFGNGDRDLPFDSGDHVQCVTSWHWPDALDDVTVDHLCKVQAAVAAGRWRENHQAKDWVGHAVAQVMKLDATNKAHKAKILGLVKIWLSTGMLVTVEGEDEKRMKRTFIEVGERVTD